MNKMTAENYEGQLELATMRIEDAAADIVPRLRYCFPDLPIEALDRMAARHPDVERERRHCRRWASYCRRRIRSLRAVEKRAKARR